MLIKGLYSIGSFEYKDGVIRSTIHLNKDHDVFKGHFPGNPVMPGVCMIQIMKELTEQALGRELFLQRSSNIKFMSIINPEVHPDLEIKIDLSQDGEDFKIRSEASTAEGKALKMSALFQTIK